MTVRSLSKILDEAAEAYICEQFEDSDLEVNYATTFGQSVTTCEHGDVFLENVFRLMLWVGRVGGGEYCVAGTVPTDMIMSGDMDPVRLLCHEVSERAKFGLVMVESGQDLSDVEETVESEEDGS